MKFSWLALSLLAGGGAAIGTVSDKVLNSEGRILVKGTNFPVSGAHVSKQKKMGGKRFE